MSTQYMVLIAIGPVQDFIATARRCRDLWFGSYVLSELSKSVAQHIAKQEGSTLIFPAPEGEKDLELEKPEGLNVANKILAIVTSNPQELCEAARKAAEAHLQALADRALKTLKPTLSADTLKTIQAQLADVLELYWVAVEYDGKDYKTTRDQVETLMAARKHTRDFSPVAWGSSAPKSSLDGMRESVLGGLSRDALARKGIRAGEQLCGVGLMKRLGVREATTGDGYVFSTSHVAALPFMNALERCADHQKIAVEFRKYLEILEIQTKQNLLPTAPNLSKKRSLLFTVSGDKDKRYDGHVFFEERLADYFAGNTDKGKTGGQEANQALQKADDQALQKARQALQHFYRVLNIKQRPMPYYALVLADGDRMGKAIDAINSHEHHQNISKKLAKFAGNARAIVEKDSQGALIYAGGDDVLALLPLHTVLGCVSALAHCFKTLLGGFETGEGIAPTLSVGVAIAHHLEPLSDVLELARKAEKVAKKQRNSLAITLSKRSGADLTIAGTWGEPEWQEINAAHWDTMEQRIKHFTKLHHLNAIPDSFAYELRHLVNTLGDVVPEVIYAETLRIFKRKRTSTGEKLSTQNINAQQKADMQQKADVATRLIEKFKEHLNMDTTQAPNSEGKTKNTKARMESLAGEMIVARLFAEVMSQDDTDFSLEVEA